MEDYIVLKTGYNNAINDSLKILSDFKNFDIIEDRLNRLKRKNELKNEYKGTVSKYYDKENKIGFIILDDIYELKGYQILIEDNKYIEIPENELLYVIKTQEKMWSEDYAYRDRANAALNSVVVKFQKG